MEKMMNATLFRGMKPLEVSEFLILGIMVILLPIDWQLVMWMMPLLVLNAVARMVVGRRVGNGSLSPLSRWGLWIMVALYLYQVLSLTYTTNLDEGCDMLLRRLPLLVFPLCFLSVDSGYLTRYRLRTLMWLFTGCMVVKFFVRLAIMLFTHHKIVFSSTFDPLHHTYMAMYLMMALGFLYSEWHRHRHEMSKALSVIMYLSVVVVVVYTVMVLSRTGIVGVVVIAFAVIAHQIFVLKEVRRGLCMLFGMLIVGTGVFFLLPESARRMTQTLEEVSSGDTSDARFYIMKSSLRAIGESLPFGVGIGDKNEALAAVYEETGDDYANRAQWNSHNIYLDSLLTTGIPGLLLLLALLAVPSVEAVRQRDLVLLSFVFTVAFSGLFEALFNRQMGIMYIGFLGVLLMSAVKEE